jgi:hypothetical protein
MSLAAGGVIATNRILSAADALIEDTPVTTTAGGIAVTAVNTSSIAAEAHVAMASGAKSWASSSPSTPSAGSPRTSSSPRSTRSSATP